MSYANRQREFLDIQGVCQQKNTHSIFYDLSKLHLFPKTISTNSEILTQICLKIHLQYLFQIWKEITSKTTQCIIYFCISSISFLYFTPIKTKHNLHLFSFIASYAKHRFDKCETYQRWHSRPPKDCRRRTWRPEQQINYVVSMVIIITPRHLSWYIYSINGIIIRILCNFTLNDDLVTYLNTVLWVSTKTVVLWLTKVLL